MKLRELKDLSLDELRTRERELTDELFHLRLKRATAQLPNPMKMRETRRDAGAREDAAASERDGVGRGARRRAMTHPRPGARKVREGVVVSDKMDKTVVVVVERLVRHQRYHKYRRRRARYKAHDEKNHCRVGDRVRIIETRPLSAHKRWAVLAILGRQRGARRAAVGRVPA